MTLGRGDLLWVLFFVVLVGEHLMVVVVSRLLDDVSVLLTLVFGIVFGIVGLFGLVCLVVWLIVC